MEEGDARWESWLDGRERVREMVARFINAEADEIAFTTNTSTGMSLIVDALEGRGDVISCELEFPVSTLPWMHRGCRVHLMEAHEGEFDAEDVRRARASRDHDALDFGCPFVDLGDLRVAEEALHGVVLHVAVAAEDLHGVGGDGDRGLAGAFNSQRRLRFF